MSSPDLIVSEEQVTSENSLHLDTAVTVDVNNNEERTGDSTSYATQLVLLGIPATLFSIGLSFHDVVTDVFLSIEYYNDRFTSFFVLTLFFTIFPALAIAIISIILYFRIRKKHEKSPGNWKRAIQVILSMLHLGIVLRYISSIYYSYKIVAHRKDEERKKAYCKKMDEEDSNAAFLGFLETFLEAASQLTLQLYIILLELPIYGLEFYSSLQGVSIFISFSSLSFCLLTFNRTMRQAQDNKAKLPLFSWGSLLLFTWQLCITISRITTLALFASAFPHLKIILPLYGLHWGTMYLWIVWTHYRWKPEGAAVEGEFTLIGSILQALANQFSYAVFAYVYIFVYFNTLDRPSRRSYILYYTTCLVEGSFLLGFTLRAQRSEEMFTVYINLCAISYSLYFLGIILMLIYFKWFHPSLKWKRKQYTSEIARLHVNSYNFCTKQFYAQALRNILACFSFRY